MLANITSCLVSRLLLAALSLHLCRVTVGTPLKTTRNTKELDTIDTKGCVELSRNLLSNVESVLKNVTTGQADLFKGFNCTELGMEVNSMVSACEPNVREDSGCSGTQNTRFNQNTCMGNIKVDLEYQRNKLMAYERPLPDELNSVINAINNLLENCKFPSAPQDSTLTAPSSPQSLTDMDAQFQLCRELKGFRVRTITINRIMGYLTAREKRN